MCSPPCNLQRDPADVSTKEETTKSTKPGHNWANRCQNNNTTDAVFLDMGVTEPDVTPLELLKAGDIESNPGPRPPPEPPPTCRKCKKKFRKAPPIECSKCLHPFHKTICTGESREAIEDIVKKKKRWVCKNCRGIQTETNEEREDQVTPAQTNPNCGGCGATFSKNIKPIKCVSCNNNFHKTTCTNE